MSEGKRQIRRTRPPVIKECILGHEAGSCPVARPYIYQKKGCRGADCILANSEYYAAWRDKKRGKSAEEAATTTEP